MAAITTSTLPTKLVARTDAIAAGVIPADAIALGFPTLDKFLGGGVRRGDLVVLGGDVASGKSSLALAFALRASRRGTRTLFLSTEMTQSRIVERMLAIEGRAAVDVLRRGTLDDEARARIAAVALDLEQRAPEVAPVTGGSPSAVVEALAGHGDIELVIVDSLQGIAGGRRSMDEELASGVRAMKRVATEHDVALVLTAHLPAHRRERPDPRPVLDDYGALCAVKQHADVALGLFREEMYTSGRGIEGATELSIQKNRNGATGYIDLYFFAACMRFEDMVEE